MACHLISTKLLPELILTFIVRMQQFSFKKMYFQMLAILLNPQCVEDIVVWQMYWFLYCLHRLLYVSSNGVIYGLLLSLNKKSNSWLMLRVQKKDFCEIKCQNLIIVSAMTQDGSVTFTSHNRLLLPLKCTYQFLLTFHKLLLRVMKWIHYFSYVRLAHCCLLMHILLKFLTKYLMHSWNDVALHSTENFWKLISELIWNFKWPLGNESIHIFASHMV